MNLFYQRSWPSYVLTPFQINQGIEASSTGEGETETHGWVSFFYRSLNPVLETSLIFVLFALFAGQLPPDVNETHYLAKAKHFWNHNWCPGDIFLESSNAHWLFYAVFGGLTKWVSLPTFAWIGRIFTWMLLAFAWRRLSWQLFPGIGIATLSAIVFVLLSSRFHLAGEWVVGGFEAKGIAYFFVLLAMAEMISPRWTMSWVYLGLAGAFHVLVGGWALLAMIFCWVAVHWRLEGENRLEARVRRRVDLGKQLLPILGGLCLMAVGALPPLLADRAVPLDVTAAASLIYFNQRIAHHLTFEAFPTMHVARFMLMMAVWIFIFRQTLRRWPTFENSLRKLFLFGLASLLFSLLGLLISGLATVDAGYAGMAAGLLRFYWFRLADFAIPATMALTLGLVVGSWLYLEHDLGRKICAIVFVAAMFAAASAMICEKYNDPRPFADRKASLANEPVSEDIQSAHADWLNVCQWIEANTDRDATFITPVNQQNFKWYAGRSEVVNWKDIPQNAEGIVEWSRRVQELLEPQKRYQAGLMAYSDDQLREIGKRYDARYLLLPQWQIDGMAEPTKLTQVYPTAEESEAGYVVFDLTGD